MYLLHGSEAENQQINKEWMARIYHSPKDDMNQPLNYTAAVTMSQLYFLLGDQIANDQRRPSWNPGDFLGTRSGGIK